MKTIDWKQTLPFLGWVDSALYSNISMGYIDSETYHITYGGFKVLEFSLNERDEQPKLSAVVQMDESRPVWFEVSSINDITVFKINKLTETFKAQLNEYLSR